MTAEEFLDDWFNKKGYVAIDQADDIEEALIDFAKHHVELALEEAAENASIFIKTESEYQGSLGNEEGLLYADKEYSYIDKDSILNAYPLTKIT